MTEWTQNIPSGINFVSIKKENPPENVTVIVIQISGIAILGRNINGHFCEYDSINDKFIGDDENDESSFKRIAFWAQISQNQNTNNGIQNEKKMYRVIRMISNQNGTVSIFGVSKEWKNEFIAIFNEEMEAKDYARQRLMIGGEIVRW